MPTPTPNPPSLAPEPGMTQLHEMPGVGRLPRFLAHDPTAGPKLAVTYFYDPTLAPTGAPTDGEGIAVELRGNVWFGPGAEGPPGSAHGGSLASVLDEAMGIVCWMAGFHVVAAELTTRFLAMMPIGAVAQLRARVTHAEGRCVYATASLTAPARTSDPPRRTENTPNCEADGLYITLTSDQLANFRTRQRT